MRIVIESLKSQRTYIDNQLVQVKVLNGKLITNESVEHIILFWYLQNIKLFRTTKNLILSCCRMSSRNYRSCPFPTPFKGLLPVHY